MPRKIVGKECFQMLPFPKPGDSGLSLDTSCLPGETNDWLAVEGRPVHLYGVHSDNENSYGRRFGGPAFLAFGGGVGCLHA